MKHCYTERCFDCGRFMKFETGCAWQMYCSGYPPIPDQERFKCLDCTIKNGPFHPQHGIKPEYSCGIMKDPK